MQPVTPKATGRIAKQPGDDDDLSGQEVADDWFEDSGECGADDDDLSKLDALEAAEQQNKGTPQKGRPKGKGKAKGKS